MRANKAAAASADAPGGGIWPAKKPEASAAPRPSPADRTLAPEKPGVAATAPPSAAIHQISTPEKRPERWTRCRGVALDVYQVQQVVLGHGRDRKGSCADEGDSLRLDRWLGSGAGTGDSQCSSTDKFKAGDVKLPEKYQILFEFFNCIESSIRLLRMKGSMATFPNICTSIQHLSGRRFTYSHLTMLKYVLPEAIVVKKIVLREDVTCCMKPDPQVILLVDAVESNPKNKGETGHSVLRRIFQQRLMAYFQEHPEGDDIPEHELPHPFNQTKSMKTLTASSVVVKPTVVMSSSVPFEQQPVLPSHMSPSFKRRFSQESPTSTSLIKSSCSVAKEDADVTSPGHRTSMPNTPNFECSYLNYEPSEKTQIPEKDVVSKHGVYDGTPTKSCSTPIRLMVAAPEIHALK